MKPLTVTLPAVSKRLKKKHQRLKGPQRSDGAERVAKCRQRKRENAEKFEEMKIKKSLENMRYKQKVKEQRKIDKTLDQRYKEAQNRWQRKSRERKKEKEKEETMERPPSSNRKEAQQPNLRDKDARRSRERTKIKDSEEITERQPRGKRRLSTPGASQIGRAHV